MTQAVARIGRPRRLAIDVAGVANLVGTLGKYLGLAALFPIPFALAYSEPFYPFVVAGVVTSGLGLALERATANASGRVGVREGFLVVALTWLLAAAFAAIPYLFEGGDQLSSPLDAYFEGMSGFTTTGASVVTDYDAINRSLGIWRQFTQWLGGMGIIVLAIAVLPRLRVGGRQLMESELPGPGDRRARRADPRRPLASCGSSTSALTAIQVLMLSSLWVSRHRRADDPVPGSRARVRDDADGRLLDAADVGRGLLSSGTVDPRARSWPSRARTSRSCIARSCDAARRCSRATRSSASTSR